VRQITVAVINSDQDNWGICGKIEKLHKHLVKCNHTGRAARHCAYMGRGAPGGRKRKHVDATFDDSRVGTDVAMMVDGTKAPLPPGKQDWFDAMLCRSAISAGWSWSSLNDPEFVKMMGRLRSDLKIPDQCCHGLEPGQPTL
jgi:hypothetical protein